ncbi:hypothetical protein GCM10023084_07660 [Streptomyces lacrimifluminis]|uniref:Uncharacterized protein n=1 Tax=Streptomyces lacrimifluminis TaxID=1500077 RepID=A0A917KQH2_9ACTN|nr:hypothetical protein GCM10012282_22220 [Streptomyces lacrimifluminis]
MDSRKERTAADALAARMAAVLVRAQVTERFGVFVQRIPVSRDEAGWGVYLADRMPDQEPPAGLTFGAPTRVASARAA